MTSSSDDNDNDYGGEKSFITKTLIHQMRDFSKRSNVIHHKFAACLLGAGNKILAMSANYQDDKLRIVGRRKKLTIPSLHAEVAVIIQLLKKLGAFKKGSKYKRQDADLIVFQFSADGTLLNSKPCRHCKEFIEIIRPYVRIGKVFYSLGKGDIPGYENTTFSHFKGWSSIITHL